MSNSFNEKLDEIFDDDYFNADQAKQAIRYLIVEEVIEAQPDILDIDKYPDAWERGCKGLKQAQRSIVRGGK